MMAQSVDYEDFWNEFKEIEEGKELDDSEEVECSKTPDEGELEVNWLKEAGLDVLVQYYEDGKELKDDDLEQLPLTLTKSQVATVKKRIDTLNATIRRRQKHHIPDVRDVFPQATEYPPSSPTQKSPTLPPLAALSPLVALPSSPRGREDKKIHYQSKVVTAKDVSLFGNKREYLKNILSESEESGIETLSIHSIQSQTSEDEKKTTASDSGIDLLEDSIPEDKRRHRPSTIVDALISGDKIKLANLTTGEKQEFSFEKKPISPGHHLTTANDLPEFMMRKDKLGITTISDLSNSDLAKIRSLTLIEVTALFDTYGITYCRRKLRQKRCKEIGVFGVPLTTLYENDRKKYPHLKVPLIFEKIVHYIEHKGICTDGILRVSGALPRIKNLIQEIEARYNETGFTFENVSVHDVSAVLKKFLRELPVPLLTNEYIEAFTQVSKIPDPTQQVKALNLLIILLPDAHRNTLKRLLEFLFKVVQYEKFNRMNFHNVATILAPNLFLQAGSIRIKGGNVSLEKKLAEDTSRIVRMLIKYYKILWTIPGFLIKQIRQSSDFSPTRKLKDRPVMKFMNRKAKLDATKKSSSVNLEDTQGDVIRVHAPQLSKTCTAIQLDPTITAGHIIARFRPQLIVARNRAYSEGEIRGCGSPPLTNSVQSFDPRLIFPLVSQVVDVNTTQSSSSHHSEISSTSDHLLSSHYETYHLYEVGGNIGERCLDNEAIMLAVFQENPHAEWVIKSCSC